MSKYEGIDPTNGKPLASRMEVQEALDALHRTKSANVPKQLKSDRTVEQILDSYSSYSMAANEKGYVGMTKGEAIAALTAREERLVAEAEADMARHIARLAQMCAESREEFLTSK